MATAPGVATPDEYVGATIVREQTNLWADAWRRLKRNRLALVSTILLCGLVLVALVSLFWTPYPIWRQGVASTYQTPNSHFLLGADAAGRDIVSRLMVGAQISLEVGVGTQIVVALIGITIGLIAGYFRGWLDGIFSTLINIFYGIPDLLVALLLVLLLGRGLDKIIFAIAATRWMDMARLVRGQTLALREREFVEAARASGTRPNKILSRHILPNALGPIIVQATFGIPQAILFEAFLSFLGLGVQPPTPSWGAMAADGFHALRIAPHIVLAPAIALSLTLMAFNFLGDGLRDALDPRQKR
ncbi:MAG: ABC transporter permease [Chloroflexi bacterium]|nr:MAG: ABC transporter permease [Chloroflexota bacterium]TME55266.1 MAG: ABC transporter permease [Chloroflexota bacterium]